MINKYYFTFGTDERFPYQCGCVTVEAESRSEAIELFNKKHPNFAFNIGITGYFSSPDFYKFKCFS